MWDRVLENVYMIDPMHHREGRVSIAIQGHRIAKVAHEITEPAIQRDDYSGLCVMPGLIDTHLHLGSIFGSPYGARMAAAAGVTTALDMAGPIDDILHYAKRTGSGIRVAMLRGFDPMRLFGSMIPTDEQMRAWLRRITKKGALGAKIMGGHWPLPLRTAQRLVRLANEENVYIAWHAGSETAGSNIEGMRRAVAATVGLRCHLAHINAYCRGRIASVEEEVQRAKALLEAHPNLWCESYVSPNNGTILTCDEQGEMIDHVTRTCLATFGHAANREGMKEAFLAGHAFAIKDQNGVSDLVGGQRALEHWLACRTDCAGSFPVNPATSRFMLASAKRADGSFVVDAISTDGGCIPRNVTLSVGLSLVKFGAITLQEFVVKTSLNPARHLRLFDRGGIAEGYLADLTIFDLDGQKAVETIVDGKTIYRDGVWSGRDLRFVTLAQGKEFLRDKGFATEVIDLTRREPARWH